LSIFETGPKLQPRVQGWSPADDFRSSGLPLHFYFLFTGWISPAFYIILTFHACQLKGLLRSFVPGLDKTTMPSILTILGTVVAAYLSTFVYALIRNLINARKTGFPYIVVPIDQNHFTWMIASVPLRPWLQRNLPSWIWNRLTLTIYGYEFHEKLRPFEEYFDGGKSYTQIGCGMFEFWTSDPEIASQILGRPRDFVQFKLTELFVRMSKTSFEGYEQADFM
jgi:hypothetical protein